MPAGQNTPQLAAPGKGLPFPENLIARYIIYPQGMRNFEWHATLDRWDTETSRILEFSRGLSDDAFFTPQLIDRLRGLEDSSRFWSVAMVMEHLIMTMKAMTQIAEGLALGRVMNVRVSTADVKPKGGRKIAKTEWERLFRASSDECIARLGNVPQPASDKERLAHPFFGKIPAKGWVFVLGIHQTLHRKQIEEILERAKTL